MKEPFKFSEEEFKEIEMHMRLNGMKCWREHLIDRIEQIISSREDVEGGEVESESYNGEFEIDKHSETEDPHIKIMWDNGLSYGAFATVADYEVCKNVIKQFLSELARLRAALSEKEARMKELEKDRNGGRHFERI